MRNALLAGANNTGKIDYLKQMLDQATQNNYEVVIFDTNNQFKNWSAQHGNQVLNAEQTDTKDVDVTKPIDFLLQTADLNNKLLSSTQYLLSSLFMRFNSKNQKVCVVFPNAEKYLNSTNPDAIKYLNYWLNLCNIIRANKGIAIMSLSSVATIIPSDAPAPYLNDAKSIINDFDQYDLFRMPKTDASKLAHIIDNETLKHQLQQSIAKIPQLKTSRYIEFNKKD